VLSSVRRISLAFYGLSVCLFPSGILVRDEAGRDKLRQQVGDIGLIMSVLSACRVCSRLRKFHRTLYESKGLEFNDVYLPILLCFVWLELIG
jgi:hypothetical protein